MFNRLFLTGLFVILGCACDRQQQDASTYKPDEPLSKVTFAFTNQPQSTLAHVAMAKGYFKEEGLAIQPQLHSFGKSALQSVIENTADFATVAETPVMFGVLNDAPICVLAMIEASGMNNAIVARGDRNIASFRDLKGKRIGFTPGTTSDFFLDSMLTANALTRNQIKAVPLKPEEMPAAMLGDKVDAVSTWNYPLTQIKQQMGQGATLFYDQEIYTETFNIAAQQDYVSKNPEITRRFLRALIKAEEFVAKNPGEAQDIMARDTQIDKSLVQAVWNNFNYRVRLDQTLLIALEDEARWAIRNKLTSQTSMPDYSAHIHGDSLKSVKAEAVILNK